MTKAAWVLVAMLGACAAAHAQEKHPDKGATFEDAVITGRVSSALGADPELKQMRISVETREGVVYLSGQVDSMAQVERAAVLAFRIRGVAEVKNAIRVANRPSRASAEPASAGACAAVLPEQQVELLHVADVRVVGMARVEPRPQRG